VKCSGETIRGKNHYKWRKGIRARACLNCGGQILRKALLAEAAYCSPRCVADAGANIGKPLIGKDNHAWKGGRTHNGEGYVMVKEPGGEYQREHRAVMEVLLGRPLKSTESVHHKNGIRDDNRPENLEVWERGHPPGQRISDLKAEIRRLKSELRKAKGVSPG
jgi:hypothetical protein